MNQVQNPTPIKSDSTRPPLITFIGILGILYSAFGIFSLIMTLLSSFQEVKAALPEGTDATTVAQVVLLAAGGVIVVILASAILRLVTAIGLLKMRKWAFKLFIAILVVSVLTTISSFILKANLTLNLSFLIIEVVVFSYLYSVRGQLK